MKEDTRKTYQKLKNELERMVPDVELEHVEKDLLTKPKEEESTGTSEFWENIKRITKNVLVTLLCVFIAVLWWFDWNFEALANSTTNFVTDLFGDEEVVVLPEAPPVPTPEVPSIPELSDLPDEFQTEIQNELTDGQNNLDMSMTDYVSAMQEAGYRGRYSMPELSAFYRAGVEISYLDQLNEGEFLNQLSFPAIISYHAAGVTMEYLREMSQAGYLQQFSFPGFAAFYSAAVPVSYLDDLREKGMLEDLSFFDVLVMYQSEQN